MENTGIDSLKDFKAGLADYYTAAESAATENKAEEPAPTEEATQTAEETPTENLIDTEMPFVSSEDFSNKYFPLSTETDTPTLVAPDELNIEEEAETPTTEEIPTEVTITTAAAEDNIRRNIFASFGDSLRY